MRPERRRQIVLAALVVILAVAVYRALPRPAGPPPPSSNPRETARSAPGGQPGAPDVRLEALQAERPKPDEGASRNLFRFGRQPAPEPPPAPPTEAPFQRPPPGPVVPTVPPIPLKFVGTMDVKGRGLMAVLSDGSGREPVSGFAGDIVLGQFRIVHVGPDSVELAYLDGRGRQTIRLGS